MRNKNINDLFTDNNLNNNKNQSLNQTSPEKLKPGEIVSVLRSNGDWDPQWKIKSVSSSTIFLTKGRLCKKIDKSKFSTSIKPIDDKNLNKIPLKTINLVQAVYSDDWTLIQKIVAETENPNDILNLVKEDGSVIQTRPLLIACEQGNTAVMRLLLLNGADPAAKNNNGCCALHIAASKGYHSLVEMLLDCGAVINSRCDSKKTALHHSVESNSIKVAEILLNRNCDTNLTDNHNETALNLSNRLNTPEIHNYLSKSLPKTLPNPKQNPPLHQNSPKETKLSEAVNKLTESDRILIGNNDNVYKPGEEPKTIPSEPSPTISYDSAFYISTNPSYYISDKNKSKQEESLRKKFEAMSVSPGSYGGRGLLSLKKPQTTSKNHQKVNQKENHRKKQSKKRHKKQKTKPHKNQSRKGDLCYRNKRAESSEEITSDSYENNSSYKSDSSSSPAAKTSKHHRKSKRHGRRKSKRNRKSSNGDHNICTGHFCHNIKPRISPNYNCHCKDFITNLPHDYSTGCIESRQQTFPQSRRRGDFIYRDSQRINSEINSHNFSRYNSSYSRPIRREISHNNQYYPNARSNRSHDRLRPNRFLNNNLQRLRDRNLDGNADRNRNFDRNRDRRFHFNQRFNPSEDIVDSKYSSVVNNNLQKKNYQLNEKNGQNVRLSSLGYDDFATPFGNDQNMAPNLVRDRVKRNSELAEIDNQIANLKLTSDIIETPYGDDQNDEKNNDGDENNDQNNDQNEKEENENEKEENEKNGNEKEKNEEKEKKVLTLFEETFGEGEMASIVNKAMNNENIKNVNKMNDEDKKGNGNNKIIIKDKINNRSENNNEDFEEKCVICLENNKNLLFLPCKHVCCCNGCSENMTNCPVCDVVLEEKFNLC